MFERLRLVGLNDQDKIVSIDEDEAYSIAIKKAEKDLVSKAMNGEELAYSQPILGNMTPNPGFKVKPSIRNSQDLHRVLKKFSSNIILNAIIATRSNQVIMYCQPVRYSEKGLGYEVKLKDLKAKPTKEQQEQIKIIENFIENTGTDRDIKRDTFTSFCKKVVRDTYTYDQVNFEKVFTKKSKKLERFVMKDPSTIFFATNRDGKIPETGERFVQVLENRIVAKFTEREMAFAVRNPRSDIEIAGYGYSELEIALKQFIAQENTETFNDRFFSHGGTTRGLLQIKAGQQSQHALDIFRREWKNSLSGINGSWQIPVISAEDVKFVNMTPSARDMEFEKWLAYIVNVICGLYGIDPAEINFPNNGGISGSKGGSLNEGNSAQKNQASKNKGLLPLLQFIQDMINTHIISEFGDEYVFRFIGGDPTTELEKIKILAEEGKVYKTVNEIRKEKDLPEIVGGDIVLDGVFIQRIGQVMQQEQWEHSIRESNLERMREQTGGDIGEVQQRQAGLAGNVDSVNGKGSHNKDVGKDGQQKGQPNTNASKQGGKEK